MTAQVSSDTPSGAAVLERYEPVIGIEVHCRLRTASKMFCACSNTYDGAPPNTHVCPVCLGLPGALPVLNRRAVELVLAAGLAIEASVPEATRWDRKNYFYPDLPKGYQISQYDLPLASRGRLTIGTSAGPIVVGITRAHLEEDTAKLIHARGEDGRDVSLVDFNRSGAPLMEIVTEPDIRSAEGARRYAEELQLVLRAIGASDAEMENGQMRVEANISIRPRGREAFGTRVEVKNMNSFRSVERAIAFEIERQAAALDAGAALVQETRGWDEGRQATYHMRPKEYSDDYRYFPEPDLPPLRVDAAWLAGIRASLPELPAARRSRYEDELGLSAYDAALLVRETDLRVAFDAILAANPALPPKEVANFVSGDYARLAKDSAERTPEGLVGRASSAGLARLIELAASGRISRPTAREAAVEHVASGVAVDTLVADRGQISDASALVAVVERVLEANASAVADYHAGKAQAARFLVGQVMRETRGQANASVVQEEVTRQLEGGGEGKA